MLNVVVDFKFKPGAKVKTPFEEDGIVDYCAVSAAGIEYSVKTKSGVTWFKETELSRHS